MVPAASAFASPRVAATAVPVPKLAPAARRDTGGCASTIGLAAQTHQAQGTFSAALATTVFLATARKLKNKRNSRGSGSVHVSLTARQASPTGEVNEANKLRVLIAGGGVGGLMTAKALSKVPTVDVTILEQAQSFQRFGGPIQLASNALSVIRKIDAELYEDLMGRFTFTGCRKNGLVDALRTEWFCPFDAMTTAADFYTLPYTGVVDRPDLQEILLASLPEGTVQNATKVAGYEKLLNGKGVRVRLEDGSEMECDVLLGADGIWSATRAQMWNEARKGPDSGCTYSGYIVFAGETVYQPEDYFEVGYKVYMGPKQYFVCSDVGKGRIQWYAFCGVPEGAKIPEASDEKKNFVMRSFFGWSQQILDLIDATPQAAIEDRALYDRPPSFFRSWADGPVALMGDACHPMMPNLGQGGCQAMEDGFTITEKLKTVTHTSQVPGLLQEYYRERILRTATVQFLSRVASDLLLDTFTFPWKPEEGFSAPHGPGRGDFNKDAVLINYLRHLLPTIFTVQFGFLYSFHPHEWTKDEVEAMVRKVMDRHKEEAHDAWARKKKMVEDGVEDDTVQQSFFKLVEQTA